MYVEVYLYMCEYVNVDVPVVISTLKPVRRYTASLYDLVFLRNSFFNRSYDFWGSTAAAAEVADAVAGAEDVTVEDEEEEEVVVTAEVVDPAAERCVGRFITFGFVRPR
jgi:hypothetical protein